MLFFRSNTDKQRTDCSFLRNSFAGSTPQPIFIVGSGPSLTRRQCELIRQTSVPVMAMNFSGRGPDGSPPLLWPPDFWTAWDASPRFHPSIFTSPLITKFMMGGRTMDLVPGTSLKTCDCPNLSFLNVEHRPYSRFFSPDSKGIMHCLDSFILALDICYQLGFRTFYCLGTDLRISPSSAQKELAASHGVKFSEDGLSVLMEDPTLGRNVSDKPNPLIYKTDLLHHFVIECIRKGVAANETEVCEAMEKVGDDQRESQYSFSETKRFLAAVNTDKHYWTTVQYLRLARRNISLSGVQLYSCTPGSRLNAFFRYRSIEEVVAIEKFQEHSPLTETTAGRYSGKHEAPGEALPWHADMPVYGWKEIEKREKLEAEKAAKKPCGGCGGKAKKNAVKSMEIKDLKVRDAGGDKQNRLEPGELARPPMEQKREEIIRYFNEQPLAVQDGVQINEEG